MRTRSFLFRWLIVGSFTIALALAFIVGAAMLGDADTSSDIKNAFEGENLYGLIFLVSVALFGGLTLIPILLLMAFLFLAACYFHLGTVPIGNSVANGCAGLTAFIGLVLALWILTERIRTSFAPGQGIKRRLIFSCVLSFVPILGTIYFYYLAFKRDHQ